MKRTIFGICMVTSLIAIPLTSHALEDYAHCKTIISDGLKEIDIQTDSAAYLNTVFDKYCEASGTSKESSLNVGLDAVIEAIPIKFSLGSSDKKQAMRNFCREYSSFASGRRDTFRRSERIVSRAYDSYDMCISLATQGIKMSHKIRTLDSLDFFVAPAVGRPVVVNGVQTSTNIKCSGKNPDSFRGRAEELNLNSRIVLKDTPLSIVCTRSGTNSQKEGVVYDEGFVTVLTDMQPNGNYGVVLPRDARLPENKASDLETTINSQRVAMTELQKTVGILSSPVAASADLGYSASRGGGQGALAMVSTCPADQTVVGVEIIVGGTCLHQCDADGGALHKFRVKCAPRFNVPKP